MTPLLLGRVTGPLRRCARTSFHEFRPVAGHERGRSDCRFGLAGTESSSAATRPVLATMQKRGVGYFGSVLALGFTQIAIAENGPRKRSLPRHDRAWNSASRSLACRAKLESLRRRRGARRALKGGSNDGPPVLSLRHALTGPNAPLGWSWAGARFRIRSGAAAR